MSREHDEQNRNTADPQQMERDVVREERERERRQVQDDAARRPGAWHNDAIRDGAVEQLAALFDEDTARGFRDRWNAVQIAFVDDPRQSVQRADELVGEVMKSLAESFARQRVAIEADMGESSKASTENLRVALRSYRSFFERLLAL
ncbi:hypothetical protein [Ramlibacter sp. WS9]|uniref:hypothetical protein n=1 Tax=Ramlibacter sp. WS9 TaxID=1882741 RepID=UPI0011415775|nr:hypothetical protein [Ramlibacter sp. WS9]ROZ68998.1 hypothetical protein EEB15_24315 [Ramlibacter sp. WS9]